MSFTSPPALTCLPCLPLPTLRRCCPPCSPAVAPILHSQLHCTPHSVKFTPCGGQSNLQTWCVGGRARQARSQAVSGYGGRWQQQRYCCQVLYPVCLLRVRWPRRGTARLVRPTKRTGDFLAPTDARHVQSISTLPPMRHPCSPPACSDALGRPSCCTLTVRRNGHRAAAGR